MSLEGRGEGKGERDIPRDVEELKGVLSAVSEFLGSIRGTLKDLMSSMIESLDGKKLGEEVAAFYAGLKEKGVPEELARDMTKEFFRRKLELTPSMGDVLGSLRSVISKGKGSVVGATMRSGIARGLDKAISALEEFKEKFPERKEEFEKILDMLKEFKRGRED